MKYGFPLWEYQKYLKNELPKITNSINTLETKSISSTVQNLSYDDIMKMPLWKRRKYMVSNQSICETKIIPSTIINKVGYQTYNEINPPLPYNTPCPKFFQSTDVFGYFQSERYFKHCRDLILKYFELKDEYMNQLLSEFNYSEYTQIHVRRGDYLNKCYENVYYVQDINYYNKQVDIIKTKDTNAKFMIFSDDIDWCKRNFKGKEFFFFEKRDVDLFDIIRMSLCKNNIIQNSSFSWWGQWLNRNSEKTVIIPKNFFKPQFRKPELNTEMYCEEWLSI